MVDSLDCLNNSVQEVVHLGEDQNEISQTSDFMQDGSVDEYCKKIMGIIRTCQKCSIDIQGWQHYSDFSGVQFTMTRISQLLHDLISKIFSHQDIKLNINGYKLMDQFDIIREGNDALLERVSSDLDQAFGVQRNANIQIVDSTIRMIRGPVNQDSGREMVLLASRNVQKPQLFFNPPIDNSAKEPFIPLIKEKPNSIKPLSVLICLTPDNREYYSHPYYYELQHWSPHQELLIKRRPILPILMAQTPFEMVENEQALQHMISELKEATEIAVDLEHHGFRTYQGLTCLIQISSRKKDYTIDPFPMRNYLPLLNEVFTDKKITKVFHGADHDILWLQRDCGIYVVNMFDTHQAAIVLEYPHRSLAYLLHQFCRINANKTYQRADWRIRPLPDDFITYARQDSHFLLYVYDLLRNELIDKGNELNNLLHATYSRSTELCLQRYEKPIVGVDSYVDLYRRSRKQFSSRQLYALQHIYLWRDRIGRQQDESVDFVLPKHMMLQMAEVLPKEMQGILACCNPIPPLVKTEQLALHQIIRTARDMREDEIKLTIDHAQSEMPDASDTHLTLVCKHDLSLVEEDPKGLSTLLDPHETLLGDLFSQNAVNVKPKNKSSLFGLRKKDLLFKKSNLNATTTEFMSPHERYKTFLENQTTELPEDTQPEPPPVGDELRIQKIKSFFLSLSTSSNSAPNEEEVQLSKAEEEVQSTSTDSARVARLMTLVSGVVSTEANTPTHSNKDRFSSKRGKRSRKKRKSLEAAPSEGGEESKKMRSATTQEPLKGPSQEFVTHVNPFDYSQANFDVFRAPKIKKNKNEIRENFKGKASTKQPGFKKSGFNSMTWANKSK